MNEPTFWMDVFKLASGLGLGGVMLAASAWYFKNENAKLITKLDAEQNAKILLIEKENQAKLSLLHEQNKWCMEDRVELHKIVDAQHLRIDGLHDKIIEIYKSRHTRMVVEQLKAFGPESLDEPKTGKTKLPLP